MYTIILIALVGFLWAPIREREFEWDSFSEYILSALIGCFIGIIISFIIPAKYDKVRWSNDIISLKDNSTVRGAHFLGIGSVSGTMNYVFYRQNQNGDIEMEQHPYYRIKLRYTKGKPLFIVDELVESSHWVNNWSIAFKEGMQYISIEIPEGTIKSEYKLDAE